MNFDEKINRIGTHSVKWDAMASIYGVPADQGIAMWVADMDFRPPACVQDALQKTLDHGVYGYYGDEAEYLAAICWWMQTRHGWHVAPQDIFTTHGLVHGIAMCLDTFTKAGDGIVLMTPVYHAFARVIKAAGRQVVECQLTNNNGHLEIDFAAWDAQMTGTESLFILCSPHNPGGRVWTMQELSQIAAFCVRHNLILVSDEIHHDLIMPGSTHIPMPIAAPEIADRLVMMTATTKTFNIAGAHIGNVIISDPILRARFAVRMNAMGISAGSFGLFMATAAYSAAGAQWVDALVQYLDGNRKIFDQGVNAIPGVKSMALQSTYLAWVDFSGTGMPATEFTARVEKGAMIASNHGASFGSGGENFLRFNLATPRSNILEAVARLQAAFADLQ
jgi:cystathionine beta-lyase